MKTLITMAVALMLFHQTAFAGAVSGKIACPTSPDVIGKEGSNVMVWVEGMTDFEVPSERPKMSQKAAQFSPSFLVVVAGQEVDMPNDDAIAHNVFSFSEAKDFNLGIYPKGESKNVHFDKPGVVEIFCSMHRQMYAMVFVSPTPFYSKVSTDGKFKIEGLNAGSYKIKVWCKDFEIQEQTIEVADDQAAEANFELVPKKS
jgi:plastocyanin